MKIRIESVLATSVTFDIEAEESFSWGDTNHYRMVYRKVSEKHSSKDLTRELFSTSSHQRFTVMELTPATELWFKIVSFSGVEELSVDEFIVSTKTLQDEEVAAVLLNMSNCNNANKMEKSGSCSFGFEECVNLIRQLECSGQVKSDFRKKFLTWYCLKATDKEKHVVEIFVDTFKDDKEALAKQLIDTFSDCITRKHPEIGGGSESAGVSLILLQD